MKTFDHLLRAGFLMVFIAGLIIATWHLSWVHNQESRYEMKVTDHSAVFVFDRQQRIVYSAIGFYDEAKPVAWRSSALPK